MSDIENSVGEEEDAISITKKNGATENGNSIAALKEKAANKVVASTVASTEDKMEVEDSEESGPEKVNGSAKPGKEAPAMNGDDESHDEHSDGGESESVSEVAANGNHDVKTTDGETSQNVTDDESIQETPSMETSRRSSPRKTPLTARPEVRDYSSSSDEYDEEVEEIKDEDDDDSSDSIMEVEPEDPLAATPGSPEKRKPGPNIVTIDNVKTLQSLAKKQQQKEKDSNITIIDTNAILAGKATSGVTITPAKPRLLPLGGGTIGSGVTISHASGKPMSRGVGLPMGTTMTSLSSERNHVTGASLLPGSKDSSGFSYDKQGTLNDPNLTDDTFVVEAPSFIVPYVYEKPPKESLTDFKSSIESLVKELKKKIEQEKKEKGDEETEDKDTESEKEPEVVKKSAGGTFFESTLGKFVINLGMNLVQEHVQTDLLREQTRRSQKDKSAPVMHAIMSLKKNLESSKETNEGFHFEMRKCRFCSFKTESHLVLESHLETPHMKNGMFRCNFCHFETKHSQDILSHMQSKHGVRGKLERTIAAHQCPQCPFEDGMRGKLTRHKVGCDKRFRGDRNQEPPHDWEPPAKIPKPSPYNRNGRPMGGVGANPNFHSMTGGIGLGGLTANRMAPGAAFSPNNFGQQRSGVTYPGGMSALQFAARGRGRPVGTYKPGQPGFPAGFRQVSPGVPGRQLVGGSVINNQVTLQTVNNQGSRYSQGNSPSSLLNNLGANSSVTIQSLSQRNNNPRTGQPSISITPLPGRAGGAGQARPHPTPQQQQAALKPGQPTGQGKGGFVICEICDGYIKDLEQLRNHMQWIHKVKIHPKMIYNRPPLNCQKCQFRFFTDQGLERHLLGSHGLVTASMQDLANKGQDSGRCPVCGKVYQWKLLNHVSKDHNKTLKPAHLSYKCTVCTATFGQYKLFENHVYTAHSGGNKKLGDKAGRQTPSSSGASSSSASKIASLKLSDEITIIPQGKTTLTPTSSKTSITPSKTSELNSSPKKPVSAKKDESGVDSDQDVIELDDEDEEIDDDEEPQQRTPVKRPKETETASKEAPASAKKAKPATSEDEDLEEGVEEINDEDE